MDNTLNELLFYFDSGPVLSGLRSSHPDLIALASGHNQASLDITGSFTHPWTDHDLDQVDRLRRIHNTLACIPRDSQFLLRAYFQDALHTSQTIRFFTFGPGRLDLVVRHLTGLSLSILAHLTEHNKKDAKELKRDAIQALSQAVQHYEHAQIEWRRSSQPHLVHKSRNHQHDPTPRIPGLTIECHGSGTIIKERK